MLDKKDQKILDMLRQDSSLSTYRISKKTLIPQTTVLNRIRKLKKSGVIKRYTIDIDYKKIDKKTKALIFVNVVKKSEKEIYGKVGDVERRLIKNPYVMRVKRLMGKNDFVIEVVCKDIEELNAFLITHVRSLDFISNTETVVILDEWEK